MASIDLGPYGKRQGRTAKRIGPWLIVLAIVLTTTAFVLTMFSMMPLASGTDAFAAAALALSWSLGLVALAFLGVFGLARMIRAVARRKKHALPDEPPLDGPGTGRLGASGSAR